MARAKSDRTRSKAVAIDDLTQSIENLQAMLPKIEDLGKEGFPYIEGARARTEIQLRECVKRAFGDKSPEFQAYRQQKLSIGSPAETRETLALIKTLIASLEDKKLELQGLKPSEGEESAQEPVPPPPTRPKMALVPPTSPGPAEGEASRAAAPVASTPPSQTTAELRPTPATLTQAPPPTSVPHPAPPQQAVPPAQPRPQSITPEQVSSLFRPHETGSVPPLMKQAPQPPPGPQPASPPAGSVAATTPPSRPAQAPIAATQQRFSTTQEIRIPSPQPSIPVPPIAPVANAPTESPALDQDPRALCKKLCLRFHAIARQLRLRGEYRSTLSVEDEIDVQDLLHALLRVQFDDIGADEWRPGYTNGASRTTFLLNQNRLAIVVKKTRAGLTPKDLADQVRVDIERYRGRERCVGLLCFIYDPEGRIGNPGGLESDLSTASDHFTVDVLVAPK